VPRWQRRVASNASGHDGTVRVTGTLRVTGPFAPLIGALIGSLAGAVYWVAVQIWPSSVAVILSMAATALTPQIRNASPATRLDVLSRVLCLLIKYNALMALSAAKLPFAVPPNVPLALIMVCGYAASFALEIAVMAARPEKSAQKIGGGSLGLALLIGFAPAALLGIPGLIGLAVAIIVGLGIIAFLKFKRAEGSRDALDVTQLFTEACFYLGALATWRYV
jgi:adenosylcobinamide-GDP ribazoletransferase